MSASVSDQDRRLVEWKVANWWNNPPADPAERADVQRRNADANKVAADHLPKSKAHGPIERGWFKTWTIAQWQMNNEPTEEDLDPRSPDFVVVQMRSPLTQSIAEAVKAKDEGRFVELMQDANNARWYFRAYVAKSTAFKRYRGHPKGKRRQGTKREYCRFAFGVEDEIKAIWKANELEPHSNMLVHQIAALILERERGFKISAADIRAERNKRGTRW